MKVICPSNPDHKEFITTAHVAETWKVDSEGNFIEALSTDEVTHDPDFDNEWTCFSCNAQAVKVR